MFATVKTAIEDLRSGKMIILVDNEDRENEGDVVIAADFCSTENINFMITHARGLVCVPMEASMLDKIGIPMMCPVNTDTFHTAFTVSVDARDITTTGISASDRANTVKALIKEDSSAENFKQPGHIFPLSAKKGGVLVRAGHTEGSVDLAKMAGLTPAAVICEILNDDGTMARRDALIDFAKKHGLNIVTIEDIIKFRQKSERLVERISEAKLPTEYGEFNIIAYETKTDNLTHVALVKGDIRGMENVLVRVHSECLTGDAFSSRRCDCGDQLHRAMQMVQKEGCGVILYMRQEGRGIGLSNKIKAYHLQDHGLDTVEANIKLGFPPDLRDYGIGAQILVDLGIKTMRLMTNNPQKVIGLEGYGLKIVERVAIEIAALDDNKNYLSVKRDKMGHLIMGSGGA